jgi:hypothetical protein
MTEETDLGLRNVGLSYALLRIALGLNICLHGLVRWTAGLTSFAGSLFTHVPKDPSARVVRLQLRLRAAYRRTNRRRMCTLWFPDSPRFDYRLGSHARFNIRVYLAARLADGRNTTYVFSGLFSFTGMDAIQFLQLR